MISILVNGRMRANFMEVIITKKYNVTCCGNCPHAKAEAASGSYEEDHYRCHAHPDRKYIKYFVFVKSELTDIPEWCPYRKE